MKKIIQFTNDITEDEFNTEIKNIKNTGATVIRTFPIFRVVVVESENLYYIQKLSYVDIIEDNTIGTLKQIYQPIPKLDIDPKKYNLFQRFENVKIAIIDSLITDSSIPVKEKVDFTGNGLESTNTNHANIVANLVCQIASGVSIYNAKIAHDAKFSKENLILALNWAAQQGVNIINLSLGVNKFNCNGDCILCRVVTILRGLNILTVVAAGNDGPDIGTIECPGNCKEAVTVGGIDVTKRVSPFSSRGKLSQNKPDLVTSSYVEIRNNNRVEQTMMGTSFAAPIITGACARLWGNYGNAAAVERMIFNSVKSVNGSYQDYGRGIFSFEEMIKNLEREREI